MDVSTRNQNAFQANAQRKFYQWVLKWINAHGDEEMRDVQRPAKLDVPILASFLQAIGFKLVSFEKHNDPLVPNKNEINSDALEQKGTLKIAIECDASNMKAVLELGEITCQCPKPDHVKEASFWSVSGTGPTANIDNNIVQKVEETGSNLLPRLSKDVTRVLRDVSYRLFDTITCEPDVNRNIENNLNNSLNNLSNRLNTSKKDIAMIRSHTQPEIRLHTTNNIVKDLLETQSARTNSNSSINCAVSPVPSNTPTFKRQKTWDIEIDTEPRPSPPKVTSSPVLELYTSIGQIYLHENEDPANVADYIVGAQKNLEKALQMLVVKKPMLERRMTHDLSPNQDNDNASVKSAPANVSPTVLVGPYKPTRSGTISNIKPVSKISHLIAEQTRKASGNVTPTNQPKTDLTRSKSTTRLSVKLPQACLQPRRNSLYSPSPTNSTTSLKSSGQKLSARRSTSRPNLMVDTNLRISTKKIPSPSQQTVYSPKPEFTNNRLSLLKQPTKISKAIPINQNSVQSKINTGSTAKPKDVIL